jgi:hypothetical protein
MLLRGLVHHIAVWHCLMVIEVGVEGSRPRSWHVHLMEPEMWWSVDIVGGVTLRHEVIIVGSWLIPIETVFQKTSSNSKNNILT